jgi:hypothetical protein
MQELYNDGGGGRGAPLSRSPRHSAMYYYISFLRPPPTHVSPSAKSLSITPQVANDLRTVLFPNAVDLYMSWLPVPATSTLQPTTPRKLTTWTTSSAYKEIPVGLPPGGRAGQAWALVLTAAPASPRIVLSDASDRAAPFGVISMPITFKTQGVHEKQERIQRVLALGAPGAAVRITEQTSFDLDKVGVQPSSVRLATDTGNRRNFGIAGSV